MLFGDFRPLKGAFGVSAASLCGYYVLLYKTGKKLAKFCPGFLTKRIQDFWVLWMTILLAIIVCIYFQSEKMQILFEFYVSHDVRIICKRLITQPVESHIDFCLTRYHASGVTCSNLM